MIKKRLFPLLLGAVTAFSATFAQAAPTEKPLVRYPAISPDGQTVAFSYQGDIWKLDINSNSPRRLTIHEAYDRNPVFSPDGASIAFSSDRYGNTDIFTISTENGMPQRLTWRSSSDMVSSWNKDELLFTTSRDFRAVEREQEIYTIPAEGGTPKRIMNSFGSTPMRSPNGRYIAITQGYCRIAREAYRGSANLDIWVYDTKNDSYTQITTDEGQDHLPKWGDDNTLYFLSARNGRYDVYKVALTDGKKSGTPTQLTTSKEHGIRHYDVSKSGDIVYTRAFDLVLKPAAGAESVLKVNIPVDYRFDPVVTETMNSNISDFVLSPNNDYSAINIHGEVFISSNDKDETRTVNVSDHAWRDRDMTWLNDSTVVFASDRNGNYDLFLARSADKNKSDIYKSLKHEVVAITKTDANERGPIVSPDGKKIAYSSGQEYIVASIDEKGKLSNKKVIAEGWNLPEGVIWSPDNKWIAYSQSDLEFNDEIFLYNIESGKSANVSMHPKGDRSPIFSPDGSKLAFISDRNEGNYDIWFAWLSEADWMKTKQDREEGFYFEDEEKESKKTKKDDKEESKDIVIDLENIHDRLEQVTYASGSEFSPVFDKEGETIYFVSSDLTSRRSDIYKVKFDEREITKVTKGGVSPGGLTLSADGKNIYYVSRGRLNKLSLSSSKSTSLSYRARLDVNHKEEIAQMFNEAWNITNNNFYDPNFHGQNWEALRKQYKDLCLAASTKTDFQYMFNLMLGQLNASHMGMYGGDRQETQRVRTGLLGAELTPVKDGVEVNHIIPMSPASREQSKLYEGDVITAINGVSLKGKNVFSLLENTANELILLDVKAKNGKSREVAIRPASSLSTELYEQWVAERKALTEKYSNGRLGYIHIQGMNMPSFERFERELTASGYGKEGIVIDVRYNGGGWTTDYLMAVLNVRQHAYTIPRGAAKDLEKEHDKFKDFYPYSERLPLAAWTKPSVAMCNEYSYSNAEIFSHAYKSLELGPLVGKETFGAVISTGGESLIDGALIRKPFRGWFVKKTGANMDKGGAIPDVSLENAQDYRVKGDAQLEKAVETLLNTMK